MFPFHSYHPCLHMTFMRTWAVSYFLKLRFLPIPRPCYVNSHYFKINPNLHRLVSETNPNLHRLAVSEIATSSALREDATLYNNDADLECKFIHPMNEF